MSVLSSSVFNSCFKICIIYEGKIFDIYFTDCNRKDLVDWSELYLKIVEVIESNSQSEENITPNSHHFTIEGTSALLNNHRKIKSDSTIHVYRDF